MVGILSGAMSRERSYSTTTTAEARLRCYTPGCVRGAALTQPCLVMKTATGTCLPAQRAGCSRQSGASDASGNAAAEQRLNTVQRSTMAARGLGSVALEQRLQGGPASSALPGGAAPGLQTGTISPPGPPRNGSFPFHLHCFVFIEPS